MDIRERKLRRCVMPSCRDERFDLVHKFPMDNERAEEWCRIINVPELTNLTMDQLRKRYFVCSKHFRKEDYKNCESRSLNKTAYPSLFLNSTAKSISTISPMPLKIEFPPQNTHNIDSQTDLQELVNTVPMAEQSFDTEDLTPILPNESLLQLQIQPELSDSMVSEKWNAASKVTDITGFLNVGMTSSIQKKRIIERKQTPKLQIIKNEMISPILTVDSLANEQRKLNQLDLVKQSVETAEPLTNNASLSVSKAITIICKS